MTQIFTPVGDPMGACTLENRYTRRLTLWEAHGRSPVSEEVIRSYYPPSWFPMSLDKAENKNQDYGLLEKRDCFHIAPSGEIPQPSPARIDIA